MIERVPRSLQIFKAGGESDLQRSIDKASESSSRPSGRLNPIIWLLAAVGLIQVPDSGNRFRGCRSDC